MKKHDITNMLDELIIDTKIHKQVSKMLYVSPLGYRQDEASHKVKTNGSELAFESFRHLLWKGKNASTAHKLTLRNRVMHPEAASKTEEIEKKSRNGCIISGT